MFFLKKYKKEKQPTVLMHPQSCIMPPWFKFCLLLCVFLTTVLVVDHNGMHDFYLSGNFNRSSSLVRNIKGLQNQPCRICYHGQCLIVTALVGADIDLEGNIHVSSFSMLQAALIYMYSCFDSLSWQHNAINRKQTT